MKIKLDENRPEALVRALAALGHEVDNGRLEGIAGQPDPDVWQAAQSAGRFLITQDLDFSDIRKFTPGSSPDTWPRDIPPIACAAWGISTLGPPMVATGKTNHVMV